MFPCESYYNTQIAINTGADQTVRMQKQVFSRLGLYILGLTGPLFNRLSVRCHLGYSQENEDRVIREVIRRCHFHVQLKLNRSIPWDMYRWLVWYIVTVGMCLDFKHL